MLHRLRTNRNILNRTFSILKQTIEQNINERKQIGIPQEILNKEQVLQIK